MIAGWTLLLFVSAATPEGGSRPDVPPEAEGPVSPGVDPGLIAEVRRVAAKVATLRSASFPREPLAVRAADAELRAVAEGRARSLLSPVRLAARGRAWADVGLGGPETAARLVSRLAADLPTVIQDANGRILVAAETLSDRDFAPDSPDDADPTVFLATGVRPDEPVVAHVLVHALQRSRRGNPSDRRPETTDRLLARAAWEEGEANLVAVRYLFQAMGIGDSVFEHDFDPASALGGRLIGYSLEALPAVERALLGFVHREGFAQTARVYRAGGWSAVEGAADARPTSRAVLHPERSGAAAPAEGEPRSPLAGELVLADADTLGEQGIVALVSTRTGKDDLAMSAGDGWIDDRLVRWEGKDDGEGAKGGMTVWESTWRSDDDGAEFAYALRRVIEDGMGGSVVPDSRSGRRSWRAGERLMRVEQRGSRVSVRVASEAIDRRLEPAPSSKSAPTASPKAVKVTKP